jgi:hypothetical protein
MRRALIPWLLLALALVAIAVPIAQGTSSAKDPRVAGLIKKVNALSKQANTLSKQVAALTVRSNCISVQGIQQFGAADNEGYLFQRATDPQGTYVLTTAIDYPEQGQTPQLLMATVDPTCVTGTRTLYRSGTLVHRVSKTHLSLR